MANPRGVRKTIWTPEIVRQRIQTSQIVNRLHDHGFGKCEMSQTQLTALQTLLRKTLPDLTSVTHSGTIETKRAEELSDDALADIASRGSNRAAEAENGEAVDGELH